MRERSRLHALVLDSPDKTVRAVKKLKLAGFVVFDVHTPFPVHSIAEAMELRPSRISRATLAGGVAGLSLGLGFQAWTSVFDWPMNIGGKSDLALEALVPVTFELGILFAAIATVFTLLVGSRLIPQGAMPASQPHKRGTADRFTVLVREDDASFDPEAFRAIVQSLEIDELIMGWRVQ